ncbi:MAG TPA: hypothetical protein DEP72_00325 [Clostridiales bacterium]|nr:MAG: hypothetical protein A2Y18_00910 [Clostridiales bacterium GWD2_32_19]HCC06596.1 hypothetical protein [Clostridiales bacterium]
MRAMSIDRLKGEEKLGKNVYDDHGSILLTAGTKVSDKYVDKLKLKGYIQVYVEDEVSGGIEVDDMLREKTRRQSRQEIKQQFNNYLDKKDIDIERIMKCVDQIMDEILSSKEIIFNINDIRTKDEYTYAHSVNVCVLAVTVGAHMNINMNRLKELAIGAILHDVGKIFVPHEILNKAGKLNDAEFDFMKKHPKLGYDILNQKPQITPISKNIVLMHHEKMNGTGYPLAVESAQIHQLTRLVTVCDMYDAMTSDRPYRKAMKAYEVIEYLTHLSTTELDREMVDAFRRFVAPYPSGVIVRLNNGHKAIVALQNKDMLTRPIVRVYEDEKGNKLMSTYEIDLKKNLTIFINETLDE